MRSERDVLRLRATWLMAKSQIIIFEEPDQASTCPRADIG